MLNDLRFAFRLLIKNPAFTAVATAATALGIGANTAVLSLVNALLVRPLPYHDPTRLVLMLEHFRAQHLDAIPVSAPEFLDYQTDCHSFEKMAVFQLNTFNLAGGYRPERIFGSLVTIVLGAIAWLASYIPAARVLRSDPMLVLAHTT